LGKLSGAFTLLSGAEGKSSGPLGKLSGPVTLLSGAEGKSSGALGKLSGAEGKSSGPLGKLSGAFTLSSGAVERLSGPLEEVSGACALEAGLSKLFRSGIGFPCHQEPLWDLDARGSSEAIEIGRSTDLEGTVTGCRLPPKESRSTRVTPMDAV
jgi:hypothetical protein